MAARILTGARSMAKSDTRAADVGRRRTTMVIADSGTAAEVLVFADGEVVESGARFRYRDTLWTITTARRDSGILVAEPVTQ